MFSTLYPLLICQSGCNIITVWIIAEKVARNRLFLRSTERNPKSRGDVKIKTPEEYEYLAPTGTANVKHSSTLRQINTNPHNKGQFILFLVNTCSAFNKNITKHVEKQDKTV